METDQTNGVFKFPERCFNTPSEMVEFFNFINRKCLCVKIGIGGFLTPVRNQKTDNAKMQVIHISLFGLNAVKGSMWLDSSISLRISI